MSHDFQSEIGTIESGEYRLREHRITDLVAQPDWVATMWLAWTGREISRDEHALLSGCLVACIDHGTAPPSAQVTRITASCAKPLADAVAAGLLTFGARHGNAGSAASVWLRETLLNPLPLEQVIDHALAQGVRLAGFGHMEYEVDPRTVALYALAKKHAQKTAHFDLALEVARLLTEKKGKALPLNIDGALGAVVADWELPAELTDAIFLTARAVGLAAHAMEEAATSKRYRR